MKEFTVEAASSAIQDSRQEKSALRGLWSVSERYSVNMASSNMWEDYTKLIGKHYVGWDNENLIPDAKRVWLSVVYNSSMEIGAHASAYDPILNSIAEGTADYLRNFKKRPQFSRDLLELSDRMLVFNAVAQYDYWDPNGNHGRGNIGSRIISHSDFYCEPGTAAPINSPDGPRWVALRFYLTADEVTNRYGEAKLKEMKPGPLGDATNYNPSDADRLKYRYEIIEWWGIDEERIPIPEDETRDAVDSQLGAVFSGQSDVAPDPNEDHDTALKLGEDYVINTVNDARTGLGLEPVGTIDEAKDSMYPLGMDLQLSEYDKWRDAHQQFITSGEDYGYRPKYDGNVYRAEFQEGMEEPLLGPEESPYGHGQIPVSFYQRHPGYSSYWIRGIFAEAIPLQQEYEFWKLLRKRFGHMKAGPALAVFKDAFAANKFNLRNIVRSLKRGHAVFEMQTPTGGGPLPFPQFIDVGKWDWSIDQIIADIERRLQLLFGANEIMRGTGLGAEASGKRVQLSQEAGGRNTVFTLALIEGPLQSHLQRLGWMTWNWVDQQDIERVCGPEVWQAMEIGRQNPDLVEVEVTTEMGRGMPQDFASKRDTYLMLLQMGLIDGKEFSLRTNIPFNPPPPPPVPEQPMQPGPDQMGQGGMQGQPPQESMNG
jgi:hypothetical protein